MLYEEIKLTSTKPFIWLIWFKKMLKVLFKMQFIWNWLRVFNDHSFSKVRKLQNLIYETLFFSYVVMNIITKKNFFIEFQCDRRVFVEMIRKATQIIHIFYNNCYLSKMHQFKSFILALHFMCLDMQYK